MIEHQNDVEEEYSPTEDTLEPSHRPEFLPEKFWDPENGEPRIEALANSYSELERRLGTPQDVPSSADGYEIQAPHELLESSPEVNQRLHEAGFSKAQAQLVYDLAHDALSPMVCEIAQDMNHEFEKRKLAEHFGGNEQWDHASQQIATWGKVHLPESVLDALGSSYDGILALKTMMESDEPSLSNTGDFHHSQESEQDLRRIMSDPKYWRDRNPDLVRHVQQGFERLYPNKG